MQLMQWVRSWSQRFFLQFGLHCATHQIRVILISCIVITSLFYPALSIYFSSHPKSLSIIEAFASPVSGFHPDSDLQNIWSEHDIIRVHDGAVTRAKCTRALRIERILVQSSLEEDDGAITHHTLLSTLKLQKRIEAMISSKGLSCIKKKNDDLCFFISPLAFWNHDVEVLDRDSNIHDTLNVSKNLTISGISLTPQMVLAGRGTYEHSHESSEFDYAEYLALTYFFPESECTDNTEHKQWAEAIRNIVDENAYVTYQDQEPRLIALEVQLNLMRHKEGSGLSLFLYLAYIGFVAYIIWSVRQMDTVHSRLGITFTALVEIAVSTITSLSICALVGFRVTMVPWQLLPIVIIFVGLENMFNLVDAVGKTSVTLSVKQRIAEGLSRAGTSNTLKVVSYNSILGVIAVFASGAVHQFCVFAIVVLVAHWFLAHTFFMAVLSIDIARLELEELLRHDPSIVHTIPKADAYLTSKKKRSSTWLNLVAMMQNLLQGRATKNISLLLLLTITATLYYSTYTNSVSPPDPRLPAHLGGASRLKGHHFGPTVNKSSPARLIWDTLNPTHMPLLHVRFDLPTIVSFSPTDDRLLRARDNNASRARIPMLTFRFILWLLQIMVLPIAATTSGLYFLLLYLLKNTELLEAQRNRPDADASLEKDEGRYLEEQISFSTLPRPFLSDVELISASKDGSIVVSVGLGNEIVIWRSEQKKQITIDATELLRSASSSMSASTITCVSVETSGAHFAVGTGAGAIGAWEVSQDSTTPLPIMTLGNSSAGIKDLHIISLVSSSRKTPPSLDHSSDISRTAVGVTLLVTYQNGVAARWIAGEFPIVQYLVPSLRVPVSSAYLVHVAPDDHVLLAFFLEDGSLELLEAGDSELHLVQEFCVRAGSRLDIVRKVHACRMTLNGIMRFIVAVATEVGCISLWDGKTGECIALLDEPHGMVNNLRIAPVNSETCHFCGQLPQESLSLAFSVHPVVRIYKLFLKDQIRRCTCAQSQLRHISSCENQGRRSRCNSNVPQTSSPLIPRARLATAFESPSFPVSAHGVHSRRASEKDPGRRSSEMLHDVPFPRDELDAAANVDGPLTLTGAASSPWRNAAVVQLADVTCERGGWDVRGCRFVGIRRRPRPFSRKKGSLLVPAVSEDSSSGLSNATLERWEVWKFDPATTALRSTALSSMTQPSPKSCNESKVEPHQRLPFTRVSPVHLASACAFAGFGNTVGLFSFSDS